MALTVLVVLVAEAVVLVPQDKVTQAEVLPAADMSVAVAVEQGQLVLLRLLLLLTVD
jgi:hypothetical protein